MTRLAQYLTQIHSGELINYAAFKKILPKDAQIDHHLIFKPQKQAVSNNKYKDKVEILDQERFEELLKQAGMPVGNRIQAAEKGDSHQVATSYSFLLVYHSQLFDSRPDIVLLHQNKLTQPFTAKRQLLIIENEENFFCYQQMFPLLSDFYGQRLNLDNCDIVFGAGNQINKGLNLCFFDQYHSVLCAFDFDFGGLGMFKTLQQRLDKDVTFVMPSDFAPWLESFKKPPKDKDQWLAAMDLAGALGFERLSDAFTKTLCFMEQEILLRNIDKTDEKA
jgi:hypothetical protein